MLTINRPSITIPKREYFDNRTQEFVTIDEIKMGPVYLKLEHSLMSIAEWESRWHVPFIGRDNISGEELLDYIRCMTTNQVKDPEVYNWLTQEDLMKIIEYMQNESSAWEIKPSRKKKKNSKPEPVEAIYYAMIQYGIPIEECKKWHFNRLLSLLDYCDSKGGSTSGGGGGSPAKRSQREIMEMYRALNEKNRKKYNSKG